MTKKKHITIVIIDAIANLLEWSFLSMSRSFVITPLLFLLKKLNKFIDARMLEIENNIKAIHAKMRKINLASIITAASSVAPPSLPKNSGIRDMSISNPAIIAALIFRISIDCSRFATCN